MNTQIPIVLVIVFVFVGCSISMVELGINNGLLTPCPKTPNCVNSQATDEKHFIQPINFIGTHQEAQDLLLKILKTWRRTKIIVVQENYIRAEFTSKIFRFVDDVEFYFPVTKTEETIIHIRSASRVGNSDLGTNRKRIEQIRSKLNLY